MMIEVQADQVRRGDVLLLRGAEVRVTECWIETRPGGRRVAMLNGDSWAADAQLRVRREAAA